MAIVWFFWSPKFIAGMSTPGAISMRGTESGAKPMRDTAAGAVSTLDAVEGARSASAETPTRAKDIAAQTWRTTRGATSGSKAAAAAPRAAATPCGSSAAQPLARLQPCCKKSS